MEIRRPSLAFARRHAVLLGVLLAIAAGVAVFDWNWLRGPLVQYLQKKSGREVRIDDFRIEFAWPLVPTVRLRGVHIANAQWASTREPMAVAGEAAFTFALKGLWSERTIVTRLLLVDAVINMERKADGLRNWRLRDPEDRGPGTVRVMTLNALRSKLHFINEAIDFDIVAETVPAKPAEPPGNASDLPNVLTVAGKYQGARFNGAARIGEFMSFRDSREWFPLRGHLVSGRTRLDLDGRFADLFDLGPVDAQMRLAGDTLANVHPFLKFKVPPSRPYVLEAKVRQDNDKYEFSALKAKVGSADFAGEASYDRKPERHVTTATLESNAADFTDLMFLAGMDYRNALREPGGGNERIFSNRIMRTDAMRNFDAHVKLAVRKLRAEKLPVESLRVTADLVAGVLQLSELDLGAAGGHIGGAIRFDASDQVPAASAELEGRNLRLERVAPPKPSEVPSEGGMRVRLKGSGRGKSLAAIMGNANGTLAVLVDDGSISNLVDAKLALNLGKVLGLHLRGDQPIALYCGAAAFEFRNGIGKSQAVLLETAQTHTDGAGVINLRDQRFELLLTPQPKKPGIFTLRSSIRVEGAFKDPKIKIDDRVPLRRDGRAVSSSVLASLFRPLLGKDRNGSCAQLLAPAATAVSER